MKNNEYEITILPEIFEWSIFGASVTGLIDGHRKTIALFPKSQAAYFFREECSLSDKPVIITMTIHNHYYDVGIKARFAEIE